MHSTAARDLRGLIEPFEGNRWLRETQIFHRAARRESPSRRGKDGAAIRLALGSRTQRRLAILVERASRPAGCDDASFRAKLAVSVVLVFTLVAAFVIFLQDKPTKVPMIAVRATYEGTHLLPPNSWTREDFERFEGQLLIADPAILSPPTRVLAK